MPVPPRRGREMPFVGVEMAVRRKIEVSGQKVE